MTSPPLPWSTPAASLLCISPSRGRRRRSASPQLELPCAPSPWSRIPCNPRRPACPPSPGIPRPTLTPPAHRRSCRFSPPAGHALPAACPSTTAAWGLLFVGPPTCHAQKYFLKVQKLGLAANLPPQARGAAGLAGGSAGAPAAVSSRRHSWTSSRSSGTRSGSRAPRETGRCSSSGRSAWMPAGGRWTRPTAAGRSCGRPSPMPRPSSPPSTPPWASRPSTSGICVDGCAAIAHSGISLIAGPICVVAQIHEQIGATGVANEECKQVVAGYGEEIMELLKSKTPPAQVCSTVGLCTSPEVSAGIESVVGEAGTSSADGMSDALCNACEMAVTWMQSEFVQNRTKEGTLEHVNRLCHHMPSPSGSYVDCRRIDSLPSISFSIGGRMFELKPEQYILKVGQGFMTRCISGFTALEIPPPVGPFCLAATSMDPVEIDDEGASR